MNEVKEKKYDSKNKTPLGVTIDRHYRMPEEARQPDFKFGVHTQTNEFTTKEIINPGLNLE